MEREPSHDFGCWLDATAGTSVFLAYSDGALYMSALATNAYVLKIACK